MTAIASLLGSKTVQGALGYAVCYFIAATWPQTADTLAPIANGFFAWGGLGAIHKLIKIEGRAREAQKEATHAKSVIRAVAEQMGVPLGDQTPGIADPSKTVEKSSPKARSLMRRRVAVLAPLVLAGTLLGACGRYAPCADTFKGWDHAAHCAESLAPLIRRACDALPEGDSGAPHECPVRPAKPGPTSPDSGPDVPNPDGSGGGTGGWPAGPAPAPEFAAR